MKFDHGLPINISSYIVLIYLLLSSTSSQSHAQYEPFLDCLFNNCNIQSTILTFPNSTSFISLLNSSIQNPRTIMPETCRPLLIISATRESHVQSTVLCSKQHEIHIRVRSGGHDYEGLSYTSTLGPFVLVDLSNLRSITINMTDRTLWAQSGATLGEVYYNIAENAGPNAAFPAGICPTVGIGGHFSGGGIGTMMRAYGLAVDHIVDVRLVNSEGEIVDRESMGEDLFWAIRGGGGCSFGVILSFKVKMVEVTSNVTVFSVSRTLAQGATRLVTKWQHLASKLDKRLFIRVILVPDKNMTVKAIFNSLFLGAKGELLTLMEVSFPELGMVESDCREMSWIDSVLYFSGYLSVGRNRSALLDRGIQDPYFSPFKAKSDFVKIPISKKEWEKIWKWFGDENEFLVMILDPFGGRIDEISESETPFPHRKGNLYNLQYMVKWGSGESDVAVSRHLDWIGRLYRFMAPYVSKHPRAAYYNYRDLDLGRNGEGKSGGYLKARVWGRKYFKGNFKRLAYVKSRVDPNNFFRNEQSVPPLSFSSPFL